MLVVPPFPLEQYASEGAVGLLVPGSGAKVSREGAVASLLRGKVRSSTLGGLPRGERLIRLGDRPAQWTFYVSLPPPGTHRNTTRYPVAVVGPGYHGLLLSSRTRVPGLVSVADVAPTVLSLECRSSPCTTDAAHVLSSRGDEDAPERLERLDRRFDDLHSARLAARAIVVASTLVLAVVALLLRSPLLGRAAMLAAPLALTGALALSAFDWNGWRTVTLVLVTLSTLCAVAVAAVLTTPRRLAVAFTAGLAVFCIVLVAAPEVPALATIGPHPDGGGRFYGVTNSVETILLVPALLAGAALGMRAVVAVAALAIGTVAWSKAGADGGGLIVLGAAFVVLWLRLRRRPLTVRTVAVAAAAVVAVGLAVVAVDALTGGSSHVTRAVGSGPLGIAGDLAHRVNVSWAQASSSASTAAYVAASLIGLAILATRPPRTPLTEALAAALVVSLLVNDSPKDVAFLGFTAFAAVWSWERVRRPSAQIP